MLSEWHEDDLHKQVLSEASELWRKSLRSALYIQEFSSADWTSGACVGELIGTWVLDAHGFHDSLPPSLDPVSHEGFERLTFHSSPDLGRAALTHYYSAHGGFGHIMQLETRKGRQRLIPTKSWIF